MAQGLEILRPSEMGGVICECKGKDCPYYKQKKCSESASLSILLPELKGAGVWEIVTGSFHSIVNVNSCLEYIKAVCGRVHMIPLTLERREQSIVYEGKTSKHYILHINMDFSLADLQKLALIDATKIMLELPAPEVDKEDILFQKNAIVNTSEPEEGLNLGIVEKVESINYQTKDKQPGIKYGVTIHGEIFGTTDKSIYDKAIFLKGQTAAFTFKEDGKHKTLESISAIDSAQPEPSTDADEPEPGSLPL
jgi:hypothetical protein